MSFDKFLSDSWKSENALSPENAKAQAESGGNPQKSKGA
jgi:hypothetical protein